MAFHVDVTLSGPVFGDWGSAVDALDLDLTWTIGGQALAHWHTLLDQDIKLPTPYYETQLTLQNLGDSVLAHDRGIIYGPWLEGVSRRNELTDFKGYYAARRAKQHTEADIDRITAPVVADWVKAVS
jgi:hypothetical protein